MLHIHVHMYNKYCSSSSACMVYDMGPPPWLMVSAWFDRRCLLNTARLSIVPYQHISLQMTLYIWVLSIQQQNLWHDKSGHNILYIVCIYMYMYMYVAWRTLGHVCQNISQIVRWKGKLPLPPSSPPTGWNPAHECSSVCMIMYCVSEVVKQLCLPFTPPEVVVSTKFFPWSS